MENLHRAVQNFTSLLTGEEEQEILELLLNWKEGVRKEKKYYRYFQKYKIESIAGISKLVSKNDRLIFATKENVLDIIKSIHSAINHLGLKKTYAKISESYANIKRELVAEYLKQCERCIEKLRKKEVSSGVVVKPIISKNFNDRGQIDLVDFQTLPDDKFKYIFHYQDHLSKYHFLRPLTSKTAKEVAHHLLQIFFDFGAPTILQSDNGKEFTAKIIQVIEVGLFSFKEFQKVIFIQGSDVYVATASID